MVGLQLLADAVEALVELLVVLVPGRVQALEADGRVPLPGPEQRLHLLVQLLKLGLDLRYQLLDVLGLLVEHVELDAETTTTLWHRRFLPTSTNRQRADVDVTGPSPPPPTIPVSDRDATSPGP